METTTLQLGLIGAGAMGSGMAAHLLRAGFALQVYDLEAARGEALVPLGAQVAPSPRALVEACDVILTSLPFSDVLVEVAENDLLPHARPGQVFLDLGTVLTQAVQRLAEAFRKRGAAYLDCPVSGGPAGARDGRLRIFVGGDRPTFTRIQSILRTLGDPARVVYCGPSGSGQMVKAVNQLGMGLFHAAMMEAVAFGTRAGMDPAVIDQAVGDAHGWRGGISHVVRMLHAGQLERMDIKFNQLPDFLAEASRHDIAMPLTTALAAFCAGGEPVGWEDGLPTPSFWHELHHPRA